MCGQHRGVRRRGQQPHGRAARGGRVCTKASRTKRRVAPRGRAKTRARARALTCVFFLCGRASGKGHRPRSTSRPPAGASGVHTTRTPCPGTPTHACCVAKAPFIPSMAGAAPSTDAGLPHPAPPAVDTPARAFKFAIDRGGTFCDVFAEVRVGERKRVSSTRGFSQPPPGSARFAPCPTLNLLSLPLFLQCPDGRGGTKYRCERGRRRESARACELLTDPVSAFSLTPSPPPPPPPPFFSSLSRSPQNQDHQAPVCRPGQLPGRAPGGHPPHPGGGDGHSPPPGRPAGHLPHRGRAHGHDRRHQRPAGAGGRAVRARHHRRLPGSAPHRQPGPPGHL